MEALRLPAVVASLLTFPLTALPALQVLCRVGSPLGPVGHALTRLTMSPNSLEGANKNNVVPGLCKVRVSATPF